MLQSPWSVEDGRIPLLGKIVSPERATAKERSRLEKVSRIGSRASQD